MGINISGVFNIVLDNNTFGFPFLQVVGSIWESPFWCINITEIKFNNIILGNLFY